MKFTTQQKLLLNAAVADPSVLLVTTAGSANDDAWRGLVDRGMLEAVTDIDEPRLAALAELLDFRAYRVRAHVAKRAADFKRATQPMGNA